MFEHLRERRYQEGQRDRDAGTLPKRQDSIYLEGYLKGRPGGLDEIFQYFSTVEAFLKWRNKHSRSAFSPE
jgi:hypothetical protein